MALTPALELAIGEQGAGVLVSVRDRSRSHARAQRDGGKEVAHLVLVVATILGVAEAQLAAAPPSCSDWLQDKRSSLRSPAKLLFQVQNICQPLASIIPIVRGPSHAVALRTGHVRAKGNQTS